MACTASSPPRTFGDLQVDQEIEVKCQRCGQSRRFDANGVDRVGRALRDQRIAGRRYVCVCGGIGLPTIRRRWVHGHSRDGRALEARSRP